MRLGANGLGAMIRRDLRRLATNKDLNVADIVVLWQAPKGWHLHEQAVAATPWVIAHGMGEWPLVAVRDAAGQVVTAAIEHVSRGEVRVTPAEALAGTALCVRPEVVHIQETAATVWEVAHGWGTYPLVQSVVGSIGAQAQVEWPDVNTVRLTFAAATAGVALLARPEVVHEQAVAAASWEVTHGLDRAPMAQFLNAAGLGFLGDVVVSDEDVTLETEAAVAGRGLLVSTGPEDYLSGEFDPNLEETYSETMPQSGTWPAMVHFVRPVEGVERKFLEVQAGDVILDFLYDVPLDGKRGVVFQVDGTEFVQKEVGNELMEYWDLLIGGERMMRTVLATRKR